MRIAMLAAVLAAWGAVGAWAQEQNKPVLEGTHEVLYLSELNLGLRNYALLAFEDDPARKISGDFRVVESPWPTGARK